MTRKKKVNVEFVHQFYTQHIFYDELVTFRGKTIVINADTLNQHFNLPRVSDDNCMYQKLTTHKELFPYEDIAKKIVVNGENAWFVRFRQKQYLARGDLTQEAKCWLHLAANNIKPTSHLTYISRKLALLIFLLHTNQPINLGKIMYKALSKCRAKHHMRLIFPHTITSFFLQAKVEQFPDDRLVDPDRPFTYTNLGSQPSPKQRETKRTRHEGPRFELELQFEAMADRVDRLENTLSTAIRHLTSLVTRMAHHQGLPINHSMNGTENANGDKPDESDEDDICSTDTESSARDDEEMGGGRQDRVQERRPKSG
ncbi:hypothetical protein K1719_004053 [Acacia pycnantha]|nr:hypothetical protein K1719_004053 [Acacia pycnantha]